MRNSSLIISTEEKRKKVKLVTISSMSVKKKVILAVSGGIDSSTAAYQLLKSGYEVYGIYLDLWKGFSEEVSIKQNSDATIQKIEKLSKELNFPIRIIDIKEEFRKTIVTYFIDTLKRGLTPNPCVICNKHIKFKVLFDVLQEMDADIIATGHYARTRKNADGSVSLLKGLDESKDQSYYLSLLDQEVLCRTIFPLGESKKKDVKKIYKEVIDQEADLMESQNLCFLSGYDYRTFLQKYAPESLRSGEIVDTAGNHLGVHDGLAFYTIGQRKGIKISAKEAYFIVNKSIEGNRLIVGFEEELGKDTFCIKNIHWISGIPQRSEKQYAVKIRYRSKPVLAKIKPAGETDVFEIELKKKLRDITPGQYAVLYSKDAVIAGGEISYN